MRSDYEEEVEEEEEMEMGDADEEDRGSMQILPESPLSGKDIQRCKLTMGLQSSGLSPPQPPTEKQWQQQTGLGLLSPSGGPPGLVKPDHAHLEHQMNMLSVLRAYSSDNLAAFNGGLGSSSNGGGSGTSSMKRNDPSGEYDNIKPCFSVINP